MSEFKGTPGPWRNDDGQIWASVGDDHIMVCDVAPDGCALTEYDIANAPLLAAAPELLESLEACLRTLSSLHKTIGPREAEWPQIVNARAAIAKALGN